MGYEENGDTKFALQCFDFKAHFLAQIGVQIGQGLVEQHYAGVGYQSAGQSDTLLLTAGKLGGQTFIQALHAHDLDHFHNQLVDFFLGTLFHL